MAIGVSTPYSTIAKFFQGSAPSWAPAEDAERIQAYKTYEDLYWGNPDAYKVVMRGTDGEDKPVYVPSGRQIIETLNRYIGKDFGFAVDPTAGTPEQQLACIQAFQGLFDRERILSKFASEKRFGLIRGDWAFHITADPNKLPGTRLSVSVVDPSSIFKITDPDDIERVIGVRLATPVVDGENQYMFLTEYLKAEARGEDPQRPISSQTMKVAMEEWYTDDRKVLEDVLPISLFPPEINAIPVYHIRNFEEAGFAFGSSEMRGLETLTTAINQSVSDEDVALAMQGLGMYYTDGGGPVDDDGNDVPWELGPGRVVEIGDGKTFSRANGINTVGPFQDHIAYLHNALQMSSGVPAVAMGSVDVQSAESGIALSLKMGPILGRGGEKNLLIEGPINHMLFDLRGWFKVYEQIDLSMAGIRASFGEMLPIDRAGRIKEIMDLYNGKIVSAKYVRQLLTEEFGYDFPQSMANEIVDERKLQDPYAERMMAEAGADYWGDSAGSGDPTTSGAPASGGVTE